MSWLAYYNAAGAGMKPLPLEPTNGPTVLQAIENLLTTENLGLLLAFFVISLLATLIIIPWIILRLPPDYFVGEHRRPLLLQHQWHPLRILMLILKNLLGAVLLLLGIAMLVLPGQGLLTMLIAVLLLDFPGKFQCERWLVSRKPVWRSVNWLRRKRGLQELSLQD